jgi:D-glycero-alpha-D-manno-heptose-7-phosphate kinase
VDLSGGTLDLWPLYLFTHGAVTINLAIDILTHAELKPTVEERIIWESVDFSFKKVFSSRAECLASTDPDSLWLRIFVRAFNPPSGFFLKTHSESPVGGGLGGSSSLFVSCYKAFRRWIPAEDLSVVEHVRRVSHLEAEMIHAPPGTQDYFPAFSGGLNMIRYSWDKTEHSSMRVADTPLNDHFLLVYTGRSHHSGINNFDVLSRAVRREPQTLEALSEVKKVSEEMQTVLQSRAWNRIPELLQREYKARLMLSDTFASPEIHALHDLCLKEGASAVKICGAGGGGCVLVWTKPEIKEKVGLACEKNGFKVLSARPIELFQG